MRRCLLPFYNERQCKIDMIVLHSVAFAPQEAIEVFRECEVSSHYLIGEDGEIWQLVGEKHRAWHAGKSHWRGITDINSHSIGIELCSPTLGQRPFSEAQKEALFGLLQRLLRKYKIPQGNIVGHSDIAPTRKPDPGKAFFWKDLADLGIGLWYDLKYGAAVDCVEVLLQQIGYDITDVNAAAYAFCRRYLPHKVCDNSDGMCKITADVNLFSDTEFLNVLAATAYAYSKESNTPCKI